MELKQALGNRIRSFRKARRLSQERLAELTNLSVTFLGSAERGQSLPSLKTCQRLADALQVPLWELFRFDDTKELQAQLVEFVSRLQAADVERLRIILGIGELLLETPKHHADQSPNPEAVTTPREKTDRSHSPPRRPQINKSPSPRPKPPGP